jgi:MFS family permease
LNPVVTGADRTGDRLLTREFVLVTATGFASLLSVGALLPVLPRYAEGPLGGGALGVGVVMGAASIVAVAVQPWAGRIGDRRGRRLLLIGGPLGMAVASFTLVAANTLPLLVGVRLLAGLGEALFFVAGATVVNDLAPEARRGEAFSYYTLAVYGGLAVGPLLGEAVLDGNRFDAVWTVAGLCAVAATLFALRVPETRPDAGEPTQARLLHPAALLPGLVLLSGSIGFAGFMAFVALYALELGLDGAGLLFALMAVIVVGIRSVGARIPDALGPKRTASLALTGLAAGLALMGGWQTAVGLYLGTVVFAVGQALYFPALMTLVVRRAPAAERSSAVGTFTAFIEVGFGTGAVTLGIVADAVGYAGVFLAAAAAAVGGLALLSRVAVPLPAAQRA